MITKPPSAGTRRGPFSPKELRHRCVGHISTSPVGEDAVELGPRDQQAAAGAGPTDPGCAELALLDPLTDRVLVAPHELCDLLDGQQWLAGALDDRADLAEFGQQLAVLLVSGRDGCRTGWVRPRMCLSREA